MGNSLLVVGGAGYVGSVLVRELLECGYRVRVLDRLFYGDDGVRDLAGRIELVEGDMRRAPAGLFTGISAVINLGGLSNDPTAEYNLRANVEMNTVASIRLAEQCVKYGVPRYIFASSCSIYDRGAEDEQGDVLMDEGSHVSPSAAYSSSKRNAELGLLAMAGEGFTPVVLRKGTIFGYSPRMRYDLVVNTFVKDALSKGTITLHCGGEMWRPLVDVNDVARAYVLALEAPANLVSGEIFNVVQKNYRISELALRLRETLRDLGVPCDVRPDYSPRLIRNYRVDATKIQRVLGFRPNVDVASSVADLVARIRAGFLSDFENPRYYNIRSMMLLEEARGPAFVA